MLFFGTQPCRPLPSCETQTKSLAASTPGGSSPTLSLSPSLSSEGLAVPGNV